MPRPRLALALILLAGAICCARPATLNIALNDPRDPNPRRVEVGAELLGVGLGLVLSWTQHAPIAN